MNVNLFISSPKKQQANTAEASTLHKMDELENIIGEHYMNILLLYLSVIVDNPT